METETFNHTLRNLKNQGVLENVDGMVSYREGAPDPHGSQADRAWKAACLLKSFKLDELCRAATLSARMYITIFTSSSKGSPRRLDDGGREPQLKAHYKEEVMEGNRRTTLIKMIHVARGKAMTCNCGRVSFSKVCPVCGARTQRMPEFWYRSILEAMGGADTCSMIDTAGLQRVMDVFNKAGFSNLRPGDARKRTATQQLFVVEKEGQRLLGERWRGFQGSYA